MNKLSHLSEKRKQYLELTKLYLHEIQKGSSLEGLTFLKQKIDTLQKEIKALDDEIESSSR